MKRKIRLGISVILSSIALTACGTGSGHSVLSSSDVSGLVSEGKELLEAGNLTEASEKFCQAMEENPKDIDARIGTAKVQIARGDYTSAERSLQMAAKIQPDEQVIYQTYLELGETSGSEAVYRRLTTLANNYQQEWFADQYIPDEPTADIAEGDYQEKIEVALKAEEGAEILYQLKVNNEYQSQMTYQEPIAIRRGHTVLTAYAVKDGVPGKSITLEYDCDYPPEVIEFADPVIELMCRAQLGLEEGEITDVDCEEITDMDTYCLYELGYGYDEIENMKIHTLKDLKHFPYLTYLNLNDQTEVEDWDVLSQTAIYDLSLSRCGITDIGFIKNMKSLYWLDIPRNEIEDISAIQGMEDLEYVSISGNPIKDISPVFTLKNLYSLSVSGDQIDSLDSIIQMPGLERLDVYNGKNLDYNSLTQLNNLTSLSLDSCDVTDISFVKELTKLEYLYLEETEVADLSPVTSLKNLEYLSLYGTPVTDEQVSELRNQLPKCEIRN